MILPKLKPDKPKIHVSSYRPILQISVLCKIFERITLSQITRYILDNKILNHRHLGFQPFRDSHTALSLMHLDLNRLGKRISITWELHLTFRLHMIRFVLMDQSINLLKLASPSNCFIGFNNFSPADLLKWPGEVLFHLLGTSAEEFSKVRC